MNESVDSSEQDNHIKRRDLSAIEQQLQAFRPRAPRLNWDEITSSTADASVRPHRQVGFTFKQLSLAVAASWIFGAMVGSGWIFWSISLRDGAALSSGAIQTSRETSVESAQPPETANAASSHVAGSGTSQSVGPVLDGLSPVGLDIVDTSWPADEPLSVRSFSSVKSSGRLIAVRDANSFEGVIDSPLNESYEPAFSPPPISNRQQLMQRYLYNANREIY